MQLFRHGKAHEEKPGLKLGEKHYDASALVADFDEAFFAGNGSALLTDLVKKEGHNLRLLADDFRFGPPIARPSKIVCVGLNYSDHAAETGATPPAEPVLFLKATSSLTGPFDNIVLPPGSEKTDWEVELAVVIGQKASYVPEATALDYVAGYCVHNDVSERAYQLDRGGTWDKGKGCDSFAPLGPYLVLKNEVPDVHRLGLWLKVNGQTMQQGNTANLIFQIPFLVAYISQFMTLLPGDVISTGTPAGVGLGMKPPQYLRPGDVVELGIDGLGIARQMVVAHPSSTQN